jgi:hypothetical protein
MGVLLIAMLVALPVVAAYFGVDSRQFDDPRVVAEVKAIAVRRESEHSLPGAGYRDQRLVEFQSLKSARLRHRMRPVLLFQPVVGWVPGVEAEATSGWSAVRPFGAPSSWHEAEAFESKEHTSMNLMDPQSQLSLVHLRLESERLASSRASLARKLDRERRAARSEQRDPLRGLADANCQFADNTDLGNGRLVRTVRRFGLRSRRPGNAECGGTAH